VTILASGPDSAHAAVEPIFDALASRVLWVGEAGMGSRLKLATNHWMITMVGALAQSMHLCQTIGLISSSSSRYSTAARSAPSTPCRNLPRCGAMTTRLAFRYGLH
jgi:3-hydroxyisobutyrate dehydrogenase-like beta-hydroxyacid dehydrogenase